MNLFKLINGRIRLFFGFCSECNSDAPKLYDCTVCNWYRTSDNGMPTKKIKADWWNKFMGLNQKKLSPEEELFELENQLDIPYKDRFYNTKQT